MKTTFKFISIAAIMAIIAFSLIACDNGLGGAGKPGKLVVTGIPSQYNGKYALFEGGGNFNAYLGVSSFASSNIILPRISGGSVTLNMYTVTPDGAYYPFTGNVVSGGMIRFFNNDHPSDDIFYASSDDPWIGIEIPLIVFKNGNANISVAGYPHGPLWGGGGGLSTDEPGGGLPRTSTYSQTLSQGKVDVTFSNSSLQVIGAYNPQTGDNYRITLNGNEISKGKIVWRAFTLPLILTQAVNRLLLVH
jgi:predicted small secreted protein